MGRPLKTPKDYPALMLLEAKEANLLQSEANSIALRRLNISKLALTFRAAELSGISEDQFIDIKSKINEI